MTTPSLDPITLDVAVLVAERGPDQVRTLPPEARPHHAAGLVEQHLKWLAATELTPEQARIVQASRDTITTAYEEPQS